MRNYIKYISIILLVSLVSKSFYHSVNYIDAVSIISMSVLYALTEFLEDKQLKFDIEKFKKEHRDEVTRLEKDISDTKNLMSKVSASVAFRK